MQLAPSHHDLVDLSARKRFEWRLRLMNAREPDFFWVDHHGDAAPLASVVPLTEANDAPLIRVGNPAALLSRKPIGLTHDLPHEPWEADDRRHEELLALALRQ